MDRRFDGSLRYFEDILQRFEDVLRHFEDISASQRSHMQRGKLHFVYLKNEMMGQLVYLAFQHKNYGLKKEKEKRDAILNFSKASL